MKKRSFKLILGCLGGILLIGLLTWAQDSALKGIIPTPPESQELTVQIWVDKGVYTVGEPISIHYSVNKQSYIYIWDIQPDGVVRKLFEGQASTGEHTVPGSWMVAPPYGTEYLQILATTTPVDPFSLLTADPEAFRLEIETKILGILPVSERSWNFTSFEIVSGTPPSYGTLNMNSTPSGAAITINGTYMGYTPRTVYLPQGYHQILLTKTGYQNWNLGLFLLAGATRTVNAVLEPIIPPNLPPVASFTLSPTAPGLGEWVRFDGSASYDPDGIIVSYNWSFGDGTTASGATRYHRYTTAGTYSVTLNVTDDDGATDTEIRTIRIGPTNLPPVASFTLSPPVPGLGEWIRFDGSASYDPDGTIVSYSWSFGDGTTASGATRYHRYTTAGTYSVTLNVTDDDGATDTEIRTIRIGPTNLPPVASFTLSPPVPGLGEWIRFDGSASYDPDGTIVSYSWSFGDGTTASGATRYHRYTTAGTYSVTLNVTDDDGATDTEVRSIQIGITSLPPVAAFTYSPPSPTIGELIQLFASPSYDPDGTIVSYLWDFDGNGVDDASGQFASVRYYNAGLHIVRLTVIDNTGLAATSIQGITVSSGGGVPGGPPMGGTAGIFVWGTDTWHVTVNAGSSWTTPHAYRLELRTDGAFQNVNQSASGGVALKGIVPSPTEGGKTLLFEGSLSAGNTDHSFTVSDAKSMWMSLKLDVDGDGDLDESSSFIYLRYAMVHPPTAPFVVGLPKSSSDPLVPGMNFRIGSALTYTSTVRFVLWMTDIATLEGY